MGRLKWPSRNNRWESCGQRVGKELCKAPYRAWLIAVILNVAGIRMALVKLIPASCLAIERETPTNWHHGLVVVSQCDWDAISVA
jgi:hypothetical protein